MLRLTSNITVGQFQFSNCVELEIESTWNKLTDTCNLTIPRKVKWTKQDLIAGDQPSLEVGNYVKIDIGYNFEYNTYFEGYVTNIDVKTPVTIECQDAMWFLKQCSGSFTLGSGTKISDVLREISKVYDASKVKKTYGVELNFKSFGEIEIGTFRADRVSMAWTLEQLKKKLKLPSFVRGNTIYVGAPYWEEQEVEHQRIFEYNIIEDDMEFKREEDAKLKIVVKALDSKTLKPVEVGDADGDSINMWGSFTSQDEMRKAGQRELDLKKYTG